MALSLTDEERARKIERECDEYLQDKLDEFNESINIKSYQEAKGILNKWFGEQNNQITKMNLDMIHSILRRSIPRGYGVRQLIVLPEETKQLIYCCSVIIRFPEIKITNGQDNGHTIKDLWVKFDADGNFGVNNLEGTRSYLTYPEAYIGYRHSHLRTRTPNGTAEWSGFTDFCKGTGEINQAMASLNMEGFNEIDFTLFCLHLKNFVEWESIEGRPYVNYSSCYGIPSRSIDHNDRRHSLRPLSTSGVTNPARALKEEMAYEDDDILRANLNPIITGDQATLEVTDELGVYLGAKIQSLSREAIARHNLGTLDTYLCKKMPDGTFESIHIDQEPVKIKLPKEPLFEFKGQPIFLTVDGLIEKKLPQIVNNIKYAHPAITEQFTKLFSADFQEVLFRNEEVIKSNALENFLQTTGSNLLPVWSGS